jgi:DNA polymerase V
MIMRLAGFPSPADEYGQVSLSLSQILTPHPAATFFVRVTAHLSSAIQHGDILVIDRSLKIKDNCLVLAVIGGRFAVRRALKKEGKWWLISFKPKPAIMLEEDDIVWGVVSYVLHKTY